MRSALVICSDESVAATVSTALGDKALVDGAKCFERGLELFRGKRYDYTFCDYALLSIQLEPPVSAASTQLTSFHAVYPAAHIVLMVMPETLPDTPSLLEAGASGVLVHPVDSSRVQLLVEDLGKREREQLELEYLRERAWRYDPCGITKTQSPKMRTLLEQARSVATTKTSVLLTGESGTGKGVLARLIHSHSSRADKALIEVHCGAIPDTLLESELFGHEKGSFTGAHKRKLGKFEVAQGGTIFLDEIGTVTPALQIKLLQVLQDRLFYRVGGESPLEVDIRVIAASNANLKVMVQDGLFREDLFYRLNVFPLEVPPLRERKEDLFHLVESILERLNAAYSKVIEGVEPAVLQAFQTYPWPGNVRELENVLERAFILETSSFIRPESLRSELFAFHPAVMDADLPWEEFSLKEARKRGVEALERDYLTNLLSKHRGRIRESAKIAGVSARQLHKLIKKYDIRCHAFRDTEC